MKTIKTLMGTLLTLGLAAAACVVVYRVGVAAVSYLSAAGIELTPVLGLVAAVSFLLGWAMRRSPKRGIEAEIERNRVGHRFLGAWLRLLRDRSPANRAELESAEQGLLLTASSRVLRARSAVQGLRTLPKSAEETRQVAILIKALRADSGQSTIGLRDEELVAMYTAREFDEAPAAAWGPANLRGTRVTSKVAGA